jgi:hypothetical protein
MNALELADALEANADIDSAEGCDPNVCLLEWNAAKELRRLHEVNAELLKAAKHGLYVAESWVYDQWEGTSNFDVGMQELNPIRAVIAKAEGGAA